jgi:uncharacterized SAM-binding protein YcdF (DUF218 family)
MDQPGGVHEGQDSRSKSITGRNIGCKTVYRDAIYRYSLVRSMILRQICNFLDISEPARTADSIFVLAGKQERKECGIDLWSRGYAPELILSVGRFEWRRFYHLGLHSDGGLLQLVEATPPVERHFFVRFGSDGARAWRVRRGRFGTWTEAHALAGAMREAPVDSVLVVSSPHHLRRSALALRHAFRRLGTRIIPVACPSPRPAHRNEVLSELCKYLLYRVFP